MKKILADCDGVLLDWAYSFEKWMKFHFDLTPVDRTKYDIGERYQTDWNLKRSDKFYLPRVFCNSSRIASLKPERDAVKYVKKLYEEYGITIDVITSLSLDPETTRLRRMNLRNVFGDAIDRVVCLDTGANKDEVLEEWRDTGLYWIEDKMANCLAGHDVGLEPIIMSHLYNKDDKSDVVTRVNSWKEIYDMVTADIENHIADKY